MKERKGEGRGELLFWDVYENDMYCLGMYYSYCTICDKCFSNNHSKCSIAKCHLILHECTYAGKVDICLMDTEVTWTVYPLCRVNEGQWMNWLADLIKL